jgi:HEAT repeat protein
VSLNATPSELLAEPLPVAAVIAAALRRAETDLSAEWRVQDAFRRSGLTEELFNALVSPNPLTRLAAARLCGALRLSESVPWVEDLLRDPNPKVKEAAIRALGELGGRRAVEALIEAAESIAVYRLAIALSRAASDIDIESLMRQPKSEKVAVVTVLACGLRGDELRVPPLLGIAQDRRWPQLVRMAACKSLGMIGDTSAIEVLGRMADADPVPAVKEAAGRAKQRLARTQVAS